jgi:cytochrome c553
MKIQTTIRASAVILTVGMAILAQPAAAQGDAEQGMQLGFTCRGCHGIDGYRNAYPSYRVPRLGGQKSAYVEAALKAYRAGTRPHPTMHAQASSMSDDDIANLVAWLATFGEAQDSMTEEQVAGTDAAKICVSCHGVQGASVQPTPPTLSGQQKDYLLHALQQYKEGARTGSVMNAFAATLSDADMELIAAFYASRDGLKTLQ